MSQTFVLTTPTLERLNPPPKPPCINVLMVEDNPDCSDLFVPGLIHSGYNVTLATNGMEALEIAAVQTIDVVLMDIHLAHGMNGIEAAGRLRVMFPNITVIFMTASEDGDTIEQAKLALPAGYLVKPFSMQQLIDAVEKGTNANMPVISADHDLLVRLDVKLDLVSIQLNEARVQMQGKVDQAILEPRLSKMEAKVDATSRNMYMIMGGLVVIEIALKFVKP